MPRRVTQDGQVTVESSDKMWSTGEGNGKPLQYPCLENPMDGMKRKKIGHWKMNSPGRWVSNMLLEIGGEITPERMKKQIQSKNNTQLWMWLVIEARSDAVKSNIAYEPGMLGSWIKANWKWSNRRWWVNIDILGVSELKWIGMGALNSDDHCIYYCGQESFRRNGIATTVNKKSPKCSTWMQSQKQQHDLCLFPRQTI